MQMGICYLLQCWVVGLSACTEPSLETGFSGWIGTSPLVKMQPVFVLFVESTMAG